MNKPLESFKIYLAGFTSNVFFIHNSQCTVHNEG